MKDLLTVLGNVKKGWKSTLIGVLFICVFLYNHFNTEITVELISVDTFLLALGIGLIFSPDRIKDKKV